jgi:hypothetical protein
MRDDLLKTLESKYPERRLVIYAGLEPVARKEAGGRWQVKTQGCSMCGECCKQVPPHWWLGIGKEGWCRYLKPYERGKFFCAANDKPMGCAEGHLEGSEGCTIKWLQL